MEDSLTSGRIHVVCTRETRDVLAREVLAFLALYPRARIEWNVVPSSSEAVAQLYAARADLAAIGRELEPEEKRMALKGGLELDGYTIASDALCVIVRADNPVQNLSLDELRGVWAGRTTDWSAFGGRGRIVPVALPPRSDLTVTFAQRVMNGEPFRAPALAAASDSEAAARVAATPGALGYVSLAESSRPGVRSLQLAAMSGLPYVDVDLQEIHDGHYPLTRSINFIVRSSGARLADGLVTFATSSDGQRIVRDAGLVPTTVPVRFVRRSPMLGTHSPGDTTRTP